LTARDTDLRTPVLHEVDDDPVSVWEFFYERGWCDGLPIIPPTPERVARMLEDFEGSPDDVVAAIPPGMGEATVEKIAVNATMAGCEPGSMALLVPAVEAMARPGFRLLPVGTAPCTPMMMVNGPIRHQLGINVGYGCLAGNTRANATLGRALRLIAVTLGMGGMQTMRDQATHGLPTRLGACFGENEEMSPWEPFHVEQGMSPEDSAVTVVNVTWIAGIVEMEAHSSEALLSTIAGSLTFQGSNGMGSGRSKPFLILGPEHAALLAADGLSKNDVKRLLWEQAWLPLERFPREVRERFAERNRPVSNGRVYFIDKPDDLQVVVAGGLGPQSLFCPTLAQHQPVRIAA
jgi:hypothetical protein